MWLLVKCILFIFVSDLLVIRARRSSWHQVTGNLTNKINYFDKPFYRLKSLNQLLFQNKRQIQLVDNNTGYHIHEFSKLMTIAQNSKRETKNDSLVVKTRKGKVRGVTLTAATGKKVDAWLGIPFARPPIGKLRFQRPKPVKSWSHLILNTTTLPNSCVQIIDTLFGKFPGATVWNANTEMSEDCLYLNIYVPKPRPKNAAVLIWIYGGGFYSGTATLDIYDPRILVSEENVIVVSIQYRVASLGFLYFGITEAPGNVGLLDQLLAIKFVKSNIEYFGGNPEKITLIGESAGGVSVSFHLLSSLSRPYFTQAIMESGTANVPWAMISKKEAISRSQKFAKAVDCPYSTHYNKTKIIECLRQKNAKDLVEIEWQILDRRICKFPFVPVLDGYFIKDYPLRTLRSRKYEKTNLLIGTNSEEGIYFIIYYLHKMLPKKEHVTLTKAQFQQAVRYLYPDVEKYVQNALISAYTDWSKPNDSISNVNALDKMVGDYFFTCDSEDFAQNYAKTGSVFNYKFNHRITKDMWPSWSGVMHGDEIIFVFGKPLDPSNNFSTAEVKLSKQVMKFWANFAKTGNPSINEDGSATEVQWPQYTASTKAYLQLAVDSTVGYSYRANQCAFLKEHFI